MYTIVPPYIVIVLRQLSGELLAPTENRETWSVLSVPVFSAPTAHESFAPNHPVPTNQAVLIQN